MAIKLHSYFIATFFLISFNTFSQLRIKTDFTKFDNFGYFGKAEGIYTFFQGEPLNFNYYRLGMVEAKCKNCNNYMLMEYLKYEAWKNGANAIINISHYQDVEFVTLTNETQYDTKKTKVLQGIAIRVDTDSTFYANHGYNQNNSFINTVDYNEMMLSPQNNTTNDGCFSTESLTILSLLAFCLIVFL